MAAPHVAGIAALLAQGNPALRGQQLRQALIRLCRRLSHPPRDVGAGLVQATMGPIIRDHIQEDNIMVMAS